MHVTEKQLKFITEIASREAIKAQKEYEENEHRKKHDRRLRNVKLLLRNYRSFKKSCQNVELEIDEINESLDFVTLDSDEFKLESVKRSKKKTLIMVKYTEKMMNVYKVLCEESDDQDDARMYETINSLYISEGKKTVVELAKCQNVTERTVYRNIEKASEALAVLLFGMDGVRFK